MKKIYPDYKSLEETFNSLPQKNKDIINSFVQYCRKDAGETTIQKYFYKMVQIADVIEKPIDNLVLNDIINFLAVLNSSNRGTDTKNDLKKTLKRFLKWEYDDWNKRFKELNDIKQKKKGSSERLSNKDLLSSEEIEKLLRTAETLKLKALISLLYESGCRPEELLKLKWADIDFSSKEVAVNSSKTGEARSVPIEEAILHLKRYYAEYPFPNVKQTDFIFPSPKNREEHFTNQTLNKYLNRIGEKTINRKIYPYIFRHTRLQEIRAKLSVEAYQKIAGHSIETALESYGHLDSKDAIEEMRVKVLHIEELSPKEKNQIRELKEKIIQMREENRNKNETIILMVQESVNEINKLKEMIKAK